MVVHPAGESKAGARRSTFQIVIPGRSRSEQTRNLAPQAAASGFIAAGRDVPE